MLVSSLERDQLAGFRQRLEARAAVLKRRTAVAPDDGAAIAEAEVHDTKDQASTQAVDEVRAADLEREEAELADIELALARIAAGTYGICCDCGSAIGHRRLEAYPTAKRCRDCQERHERQAKRLAVS